ncbi:MAG: glycosyltransferase family 4 protein [Actinomycetota bacterium]|nr:glycosyltransferase family 4 protein [Actinomycetota bacterium]
MKILVCNWKDPAHPEAGGAEVYTDECTRRWAAWGHQVTWLSAAVAGRPAIEMVGGVTVRRSGSRLGVYGAVRRFLRSHAHRYDVVLDEINTRPFFAHRHAGATPVVALAYQVAREVWRHETSTPVALLGRYVLEPHWLPAYTDVPVMTISPSSADSLADYGMRDVRLVPVGVDIADAPRPTKADELTLLVCGRLVPMKRPDHAIAAFAAARARLGGGRLVVIGDGRSGPSLRASAPEGVVFTGRVDEAAKRRLMARSHALLATSVREGWGLVVSEAAALGTPTIAYDVAGLRDSTRAGRGVLVVEDPDALAEAITYWAPRMRARPPDPIPHGGAENWDTVAAAVLDILSRAAGAERRLAA